MIKNFNDLYNAIINFVDIEICEPEKIDDVRGRFNFLDLKIYLNSLYSNDELFITLMHEFVHFLTLKNYLCPHNVNPFLYGKNIRRRELGAYYHGWKFILKNNVKISKTDWKNYHTRILNIYNV